MDKAGVLQQGLYWKQGYALQKIFIWFYDTAGQVDKDRQTMGLQNIYHQSLLQTFIWITNPQDRYIVTYIFYNAYQHNSKGMQRK